MLAKTNLKNVEVLLSKVLINSYISPNEFVLVNNTLREYNDMDGEIKNPETSYVL